MHFPSQLCLVEASPGALPSTARRVEGHPAPRRGRGRHRRLPAIHSPLLWGRAPSLRLSRIRLPSDPLPSGHQPPSLKPGFWTAASPRAPRDVPSTLPTDVPLCMGVAGEVTLGCQSFCHFLGPLWASGRKRAQVPTPCPNALQIFCLLKRSVVPIICSKASRNSDPNTTALGKSLRPASLSFFT